MVLRPTSVWTSSPIRRSCTRRSPEGVEMFVPFKKQLPPGVGLGAGCGAGLGVGSILWADAGLLPNARKGKLAAPTAVTLSSCRRVRTRCRFFMGCSPFQLERGFQRGLQIAETLISMLYIKRSILQRRRLNHSRRARASGNFSRRLLTQSRNLPHQRLLVAGRAKKCE
jgi:hypothetical protein